MDGFQIDRLDMGSFGQRREDAWAQAQAAFDIDRTVKDIVTWLERSVSEAGGAKMVGNKTVAAQLRDLASAGASSGQTGDDREPSPFERGSAEAGAASFRADAQELRDATTVLYGRALATLLVREFEDESQELESRVTDLWSLGCFDDLAYIELVASVASALGTHGQARAACLRWLGRRVSRLNLYPSEGGLVREKGAIERLVQEWRERPSLERLWREPGPVELMVDFGDLDIVAPILMADPAGSLARLDELRFPEPLEHVLSLGSIRNDASLLATLLGAAPSCVDEPHSPGWNGSLMALLLLKAVDGHCRRAWDLWQSKEAGEDANAALSSWIADVSRVIMRRNDGGFLGSQWLLLKAVDERLARGGIGRQGLPPTRMIEWIGAGLVKAGLTGRGIAEHLGLRVAGLKPQPSTDGGSRCLPGLAMIAMIDCMIGDDQERAKDLLEALDALLASRDLGFEEEAVFDGGALGFPASCMGYLLAKVGGPGGQWKGSWDRLAEQRRSVEHWRQTKDSEGMAPSLFLVASGLAALDWLCSETEFRHGEPARLWRVLFDAVRGCWLTVQVTHLSERIENDIRRLFARHPMVFNGAGGEGVGRSRSYSETLAADLGALGGDEVLVAACCELAFRNGATVPVLHQALQHGGGKGYALLRQFEEWHAVERGAKRDEDLAAAIGAMREALNAAVAGGGTQNG